jgi:hypothetical protein
MIRDMQGPKKAVRTIQTRNGMSLGSVENLSQDWDNLKLK